MSKINFYRGDSYPIEINIWENKANCTLLNISGSDFVLTVNSEKNPSDNSNQIFSVSGIIKDYNGKVQFEPSSSDTDQIPAEYYYDISMITNGNHRTIVKDCFTIIQDINI